MSGALRWSQFGEHLGRGDSFSRGRQRRCELYLPTWLRPRIAGRAPGASVPPWRGGSLGLFPPTAPGSPHSLHAGWGTSTEQLLPTAAQAPVHCELPRRLRVTKVQEASWECVTCQRGVTLGREAGRAGWWEFKCAAGSGLRSVRTAAPVELPDSLSCGPV